MCEDTKSKFQCTHVIFDMDGVILDTEKIYERIFNIVLSPYGKQLDPLTNAQRKGMNGHDLAQLMVTKYQLPIPRQEFRKLVLDLYPEFLPQCEIMPGADRLIFHFDYYKVPIALATASTQYSFNLKTSNYKRMFERFNHVVLGSDPEVKFGKPSPDIFRIAAERFDPPPYPCQCLVIEDSANGIEAALAAGMRTVMVPDVDAPEKVRQKAHIVLNSLNEFQPEIFGLPPFPKRDCL